MYSKGKQYRFEEIISQMKEIYIKEGCEALLNDDEWCMYSNEDDFNLNSICYIDDYPDIDDETYEEVYPKFITINALSLVYTDEQLQNIIISALSQNVELTNEDLMKAILYYDEYDCFFDFSK